ncbi:hypothetical protein FBUS_11693 [Fasciolopsis buskii]|uniref:Uncharacterized protein n=1 Tax=Fasciolopsis buskii TaxID=27845 RepID=A0A8E0RRR7_9TREM|nr:hypothetical protein FBUS_11693 [Fasciolopsis buski]
MKRWIRKKERMLQQAKNEGRSFDQVMQEYNARRERRLIKNRPKTLEDLLLPDGPQPNQKHFIEVRFLHFLHAASANLSLEFTFGCLRYYVIRLVPHGTSICWLH